MDIRECYLYITDRLNKLSSNNSQNIPYPQFIRTFNACQIQWVEDRVKVDEVNRIRIDELQQLQKTLTLYKSEIDNVQPYLSCVLPDDYLHLKRVYCTPCQIDVHMVKEGDVNKLLFSENHKPSQSWGETIGVIGNNNLKIYNEGLKIDSVYLSYYRRPINVDIEGYVKFDGTSSININPEFNNSSLIEILDNVCVQLASDVSDQFRYQTLTSKTNQHT